MWVPLCAIMCHSSANTLFLAMDAIGFCSNGKVSPGTGTTGNLADSVWVRSTTCVGVAHSRVVPEDAKVIAQRHADNNELFRDIGTPFARASGAHHLRT